MEEAKELKKELKLKREQPGKKRTLISENKGISPKDAEKRGLAGITHDYSDIFGWNKKF